MHSLCSVFRCVCYLNDYVRDTRNTKFRKKKHQEKIKENVSVRTKTPFNSYRIIHFYKCTGIKSIYYYGVVGRLLQNQSWSCSM